MKPISEHDYYETLEIGRDAGAEEIERAYKLAHSTYSNDSLAGYSVFEEGDAELLRERIEIAYRTLSDPDRRQCYDEELSARDRPAPTEGATPEAQERREAEPVAAESSPVGNFEEMDDEEGEWTGARLRRARMRCGVRVRRDLERH